MNATATDPSCAKVDARTAESFLRDLFGVAPGYLSINHAVPVPAGAKPPPLYTDWFPMSDCSKAAERAVLLCERRHVWVGAGLVAKPLPPGRRGGSDDVIAIPGLWADIDYRHPVHRKSDVLPPDADAAIALVRTVRAAPSYIIHTGHGVQTWWLFDEPLRLDLPDARAIALALLARLKAQLARVAGDNGWKVDAVADLARIMRIPGTVNIKAEPVPVRVIESAEFLRYSPADLEDALDTIEQLKPVAAPAGNGHRPLKGTDAALLDKAKAARNGSEFARLWSGDSGLHGGDMSAADQAFANLLAFWTGGDPTWMDSLWRQSGRMRPKWDERHYADGRTYGQGTIDTALTGRTEFYSWNGNGKPHHGANGRSVDIDKKRKSDGKSGNSSASTRQKVWREAPPPYEPFPLDTLPEPLRSYITAAAIAIVCDPALVALPLLAAATAAVGNSRRIMLKRNWTEPAVAWVVTVVHSGGLKSAAQDHGVRFTLRRQKRLFKDHERATASHAEQVKAWKVIPKDQRGEEPDPPPPCERVRVSDITVEALADRLAASPRGVLLARDELAGFFASLNQYKGGKGSDCSNYLEMHGAREIVVDRKTGDRKTLRVDQAAVSITGTIQPGALRRALTSEFFDNGMAARFLVAYPPRRQKEWSEDEVDPALEQRVAEVCDALFRLAPDRDHDGDPVPKDLPLSSAAKDLWVGFVNEVGREQVGRHDEDLAAAWSKLEGYGARLALVLHLVRVAAGDDTADPYRIDELSMASGIRLAQWFGHETERVYAALRETEDERGERELCEVIRAKGGTMTPRGLMRCCRLYATAGAAERALQELVEAKRGRWVLPPSNGKPGRPADRYFELITGVNVDTNTESPGENGNSVNVNARDFRGSEKACPTPTRTAFCSM